MPRLTLSEAVGRYGQITDGSWKQAGRWCVMTPVPDEIAINWINSGTGQHCTHIYMNKDMVAAFNQAMQNIINAGLGRELETFDGCLNIRDVRGKPGTPSTHSYALALDLNALTNQLGQQPTVSADLVKCFTDAGFSWGGSFSRVDGQHFSFAWE